MNLRFSALTVEGLQGLGSRVEGLVQVFVVFEHRVYGSGSGAGPTGAGQLQSAPAPEPKNGVCEAKSHVQKRPALGVSQEEG